MARTPALAQALGSTNAEPVQAYGVRMLSTLPGAPRAMRWRPTSRVQFTVP